MISVSILGPIEIRRDDERLRIPGGKTTEVLIRLALDAGVTVRTARLIDDLWGSDETDKNTLQTKISRLRRALGGAAALTGGRGGYSLDVEAGTVDALEVLRLADIARAQLDTGDARSSWETATRALALFRGEILCDAGDGDWVIPHRVRLEEVRLGLVEDQFGARVELGASSELVGDLEALVAQHPLRERMWELLITALYRSGRQADALATYQRVRSQLAEELGLEPGPRLRQLEQSILVHDASLTVSPVSPARSPTGNLPSLTTPLIGRDHEVVELIRLVADERLVEIVGPGGIGKTAVAIEVGRHLEADELWSGGVWLARLETAITTDEVVDTLIAAMQVTGGEAAMFERLKNRPAVVVLDNCEHIVDIAASLVERLLDAAPRLKIVCTSQVPLDVDGEVLFELTPLALADAVQLFTRRATAQRRNQVRPADDELVTELCRSLDGLPLAIELAAARTKTLSIEEITRRLDDRFHVLRDPTSRRPERRRALGATIQWSYDLLFPDDQRGLWAIATFSGGATLAAIEAVLEALDVPAPTTIDVVDRLVSRSLVIVDDASTGLRYRLLDSIRAFALEAMQRAALSNRAAAAHASWFARAASSSTAGVRSSHQAKHLAFARAERANVDAALTWCAEHEPLTALAIANGFGWAWVVLGDSRGAQRLMTALDAAGDSAVRRDRANALLLAGWIEASTGDLAPARAHVTVALEIADAIGDTDLQARGWYHLAYVVSHHGEFREAIELTDRSRALLDTLDRPWDQIANALFAARAAISLGDEAHGIAARDQVEHWVRVVDDPWMRVRRDAMLGELARVQHRFDDAVVHIARAASTSRELGFLQTEAYQVSCLGRAQCQAGDYETGAATLTSAVDKAEATGDVRMAALARVHLGRVLRALGRDASARAALAAACSWHRESGGGEQAALGECLLAAMDARDHRADASARLAAILDEARREDDAHIEVFALDALARLAAERGDTHEAGRNRAEADRRMDAASHFISERDRVDKPAAVTQRA